MKVKKLIKSGHLHESNIQNRKERKQNEKSMS